MGTYRRIGGSRRAVLLALLLSGAITGGAAADTTSATAAPALTRVHARTLASTETKTSWVLTATVADRDGDLVGGRVRIRIGAKGKVLTRPIVAAKALATSSGANVGLGAGTLSATLAGNALHVVFFANPVPGLFTVTFWVSDAKHHASKRTILYLRVKATQTVTVAATNPVAAEPSTAATFAVARSGGSTAAPLTVYYTVTGMATTGSDFTTLPGSVTLPAGSSAAEVAVSPIDDETIELPESVTVALTKKPSYIVGTPSSATVTITSDDMLAVVTIASQDPSAAEPFAPASFSVTRTGSTTTSLAVSYTTTGTATSGSDYTSLSGTVTILAGESTATITVTPVNDTAVEQAETVIVTLRVSTRYSIGTPGSATVTIADDDSIASVTIVSTDSAAAEPASPGVFTVARTGSTATSLVVLFALGGTATAGTDYSAQPSTPVTIPAGASSATITVTPIDDATLESAETVVATLTAGTGYTVGAGNSATVTIADDEPTVTITATDANAAEPSDAGTLTVTRTGSTAAPLTVFYTVSGTATNGTDYTTLPGSVTIPAGLSSVTITVGPIDDAVVEGAETAVVTLVGTSSYSVGATAGATVTIADND